MMRTLQQTLHAVPASDGDGVKIRRIAGGELNPVLDPFLMLDEIRSDDAADYIGGFPQHPHRGFETITYMKVGRMRHRDHMGNEGVIGPGDVQWMTAARGVLHSEMPEQEHGLLHGFQLWLNLPASEKMQPPAYRELRSENIPTLSIADRGSVRAIAGQLEVNGQNISGALPPRSTEPLLLDIALHPGQSLQLGFNAASFKPGNSAMIYVYAGSCNGIGPRQMGIFSNGSTLELIAGDDAAELLLLGGKPLREPIVQYGPFVMNSQAEIDQALRDYRDGRLAQ